MRGARGLEQRPLSPGLHAPDPFLFFRGRARFVFDFIIARALPFRPGLRAPDGRPLSERSERGERIA